MKPAEELTESECQDWLEKMQIFIESAVESEQDEPKPFKLETEKRIDLILVNLKELLGLV